MLASRTSWPERRLLHRRISTAAIATGPCRPQQQQTITPVQSPAVTKSGLVGRLIRNDQRTSSASFRAFELGSRARCYADARRLCACLTSRSPPPDSVPPGLRPGGQRRLALTFSLRRAHVRSRPGRRIGLTSARLNCWPRSFASASGSGSRRSTCWRQRPIHHRNKWVPDEGGVGVRGRVSRANALRTTALRRLLER
jgi:hypothetical protein